MAISYTWVVNYVKHSNTNGLVGVAQFADLSFLATETVGVTTYSANERLIVELSDPDPENFSELSSLTAEQVMSWCQPHIDAIAEEEVEAKKSRLAYIIEEKKAGVTEEITSAPWEPEVTE
tara:strand:+ start:1343 stop:1705 length:363 start_codon:yes stop_codon:yes gene_type:complete